MEELEWDIRVPLVSNVYVLVDVMMVVVILSAIIAGVMIFVVGVQDIYAVIRLFLISDAVLIVLIFLVMGFVFLNQFQLIYRLDDEGVLCTVGEFESSLNRAAWSISAFTQRFSLTGGRLLSMFNERLYVPWSRVTRAVFDERRRVATLTNDFVPLMRVYCSAENFDAVFEAIRAHVAVPEDESA
jgi:hypothetical protein